MICKDTSKRDLKIKEGYLKDGKFYDEGVEINLIDVLSKLYEDETPFTITISAKTESDVDLDDVE